MPNNNDVLRTANRDKKYEFYTRIEDIEKELYYHRAYFRDKTVLCNCDDPYESNFFKYFAMKFNEFGLKKLIATCYATSSIMNQQLSLLDTPIHDQDSKKPYKIEITQVSDENGDGAIDLSDVEFLIKNRKNVLTILEGDGDFRSTECVNLLKEADIIVTNPPFGLLREFLGQLIEHNKDFLFIGNTNALTYREVFKLFKENRIRTGYTNFNVGMFFYVPDSYEKYSKFMNGRKVARVASSCWFTSLPVAKHNERLYLDKKYFPNHFPKYYNFEAINVDTYLDIPKDYDGYIGVPVTFLDKFNPEQFELIGLGISNSGLEIGVKPYTVEHKAYRKNVQKKGAVDGDLYFEDASGHPVVPYARAIILNKELRARK